MNFVHQDPAFGSLLRIVADAKGLSAGLIEKDYWVTHTLWALQKSGLDLWFKGGTSLSKGFGLLERFSEDIDLKMEPGALNDFAPVTNWKSSGVNAVERRKEYFEWLVKRLEIPGAQAVLDPDQDELWRGAAIQVRYPGLHLADLGVLRPHVLLEAGEARVTPFIRRDLSSFVHEHLAAAGQFSDFEDNLPRQMRCVHPLVTLIEKLDAIARRFPRPQAAAASFVRHYEDAARIIRAANVPGLTDYPDVRALAEDMLLKKQIKPFSSTSDPAFSVGASERWKELHSAWLAVAPMFWGPRLSLEESCKVIQSWIDTHL